MCCNNCCLVTGLPVWWPSWPYNCCPIIYICLICFNFPILHWLVAPSVPLHPISLIEFNIMVMMLKIYDDDDDDDDDDALNFILLKFWILICFKLQLYKVYSELYFGRMELEWYILFTLPGRIWKGGDHLFLPPSQFQDSWHILSL